MAQVAVTLAPDLSVAFTLTGVGSTVTIGPPAPVVVTALTGVGSTVTIGPPAPVVVTALTEFMRGPPGPRGKSASSHPGKTLVWSQGRLAEVRLYIDAAKTQLAERRVMSYTGDALTSIAYRDADDTLVKTRTLSYSSGALTSVTES